MKDFGAIETSFRYLDLIENRICDLQDEYMSICRSLTDGHEAQTAEWYQSVDFEDSLKVEEYHDRLKVAMQAIYEAREILLTSRIGQSVLVDAEVEKYLDPDDLSYASEAYKAYKKLPRIFVSEHDYGDDRERVKEIVVDDLQPDELRSWTSLRILDYLRNNCVEKCDTVSGGEKYFIPCIEMGKLKLSVQVNYRLWSSRTDRHFSQDDHYRLISESEFDNCIKETTWIDLAVSYGGRRLMLGQASIEQIGEFLSKLADGVAYISEDCL